MKQLQLEVEAQLFNQDEGSLVEMIENLGIEDDGAGKAKMQKIKLIRKEIDSKMESDEKAARTCLEQLFAYMKGTVPPLEPAGESTEEAEQKTGATGVKSEKESAEGKIKKRADRTRGSRTNFESAGENKSGPVLAAQDRLANRDKQKS